MTRLRPIAATGVLAVAASLVAWREVGRPGAAAPGATSSEPQVILFVDLSEEGEKAGCGAIIHAVRAAAKRGVVTEEVDAREPGDRAKKYRLLIAPAVVVLDADGRELRRFEGEAPVTVKAIRTQLERLSPTKQ